MKKKTFSLLLTLAVVLSMFPPPALATENAPPDRILMDATEILYGEQDGTRQAAADYTGLHPQTDTTPLTYDYTMTDAAYPANGTYYLHLIAYAQTGEAMSIIGAAGVEKVSLGIFASVEELAGAENLKDALFTDSSQMGGGYLADFSQGYVDFTMLDTLGELHWLRLQTVAASAGIDDILLDATNILYIEEDGTRKEAARYSDSHPQTQSAPLTYDYTMTDAAYPANGSYYLHLVAYAQRGEERTNVGAEGVNRVVAGLASSAEAFYGAEDLKDVLFTDSSQSGGGYLADFSNGYVDFTIEDALGGIRYRRIQTVAAPEPTPVSDSPGFMVGGEFVPLQQSAQGLYFADLDNFLWGDLTSVVPVFPGAQTVRWATELDANQNSFVFADAEHPIDFSSVKISGAYDSLLECVTLVLLAGDGTATGQNERYLITFYYSDIDSLFDFELYRDTESRSQITTISTSFTPQKGAAAPIPADAYGIWYDAATAETTDQYAWLGMRFANERSGVSVLAYEGLFDSEEEAKANGTEITSQIWNPSDAARNGYHLPLATSFETLPCFTLFFKRAGKPTQALRFCIAVYRSEDSGRIISVRAAVMNSLYAGTGIWRYDAAGRTKEAGYPAPIAGQTEQEITGIKEKFVMLSARYPANAQYYVDLYAWEGDAFKVDLNNLNGVTLIEKAVLGDLRGADFEQAPDIKNQLFSDASQSGGGYLADFSAGSVTFTVLDKDNNYQKVVIETADYDENAALVLPQRPTPLNLDTFFRVVGTYGPNDVTPSDAHKVDYNEDSYYYNGYQTIFLKGMDLKDGDIIRPLFYAGPALTIYAGTNAIYTESPVEQETGVTEATYRGIRQPIQYSAASKEAEGRHLKNYWVTFVTPQTGGAKLFVNGVTNLAPEHYYDADRYGGSEADKKDNGLPVRELILDSRYLNRHDIVIANIGDQPLTGLQAWIVGPDGAEDSANVMIDPQYALDGTASLPAFSNDPAAGFRNITQIRIKPKDGQEGLVSGYLKITADGQEPVTVKLVGVIGAPKLVTETLSDGVKYVHYSSVIQTSNLYDFDPPVLEVVDGNFPQWATLKKNGEIYGMPTEEGQWTFKIRATFYDDPFNIDEREYTLTVLPNSTQNVWNINDYKENLTVNSVPIVSGASAATYDLSANPNLLLTIHSDANLEEFVDKFTVDGEELTRVPKETPDVLLGENEYKADEGSIIATVRSQTLRNAADGSTHTISLENRANQDLNAKMTRTSVNVTVKKSANSGGGGSSGGGSGSSGGGSSGSSSGGSSSSSSSNSGSSKSGATPYSIRVQSSSNGSLSVDRTTAVSGATVTITAKPNANYALESVTVTDSAKRSVTVSGSGDTRTFTMPARRVTVSATFVRLYRVSAMSLDFGWVEVKPEGAVRPGVEITLIAHPESGYKAERLRAYMGDTLISVTDNGDGRATFIMPSGDVEASADFTPIPPLEQFPDIQSTDWFYDDAAWAFDRGIMNGVTASAWSPQDNISTATVVVTLVRLQMGAQTDEILKEFEDDIYADNRPWLPDSGEWYYREARWAAASGILTENVFTGREPLSRAGFAVILRNYLRYRGIQTEVPEPYEFSDGAAIETQGAALGEDLNSAFQILREADVFRGDRTNAMLPNNHSTRAHMAALLHRLSDYIIKTETAEG